MGDSHLQRLLGFSSCSQPESLIWTFVGLRLTPCNKMRIPWPVKCWHTLFSFIPADGPGRKSVHLPYSSIAKLFLGFFLCLSFRDVRNLSASFAWSSSMSSHDLTWGWDVKGRTSVCFLPMPLLHRFMDGAMWVPAKSRRWGETNAGLIVYFWNETQASKISKKHGWIFLMCQLTYVLLPPSLWQFMFKRIQLFL